MYYEIDGRERPALPLITPRCLPVTLGATRHTGNYLRVSIRPADDRNKHRMSVRFTKRFATRESSGPSLAARTALQPWGYFCFFVQWVCSRALSLCSGLASLLLWPQWPPLLWLCSCLAPCTPFHCRLALVLLARSTALASLRCPWLLPFAGQPLSAQFWSRTRSRACCRLLQIIDSVYRSLLRLVGGPSE